MTHETIERAFAVTAPARLALSNVSGSVDIQRGDDGTLAVTAVKHTGAGNADRTEVRIEQLQDGSVIAETRFDGAQWFFNTGRPCDVDYVVRTPAGCNVRVQCVSSRVAVQGLSGEFKIESVSGDVAAHSLAGALTLKSVSGRIDGDDLAGSAEIDTVSGEVRLSACRLSSIEAKTVSGDIIAQTPLAAGPYRFKSISGDATLAVPPQTRCRIEVNSMSGAFHTSLPAARNQRSGRRWLADVGAQTGEAAPQVSLDSLSGNLHLVVQPGEGFEGASASTSTTTPTPTPLSHQEILDRVERGEMTVGDAVKALGS